MENERDEMIKECDELQESTNKSRDEDYICGIPVEIDRDDDTSIVTDSITNMYGIGRNAEEAIEDYKTTIKAYYEGLKENEDKLSTELKQHLDYLNTRDI